MVSHNVKSMTFHAWHDTGSWMDPLGNAMVPSQEVGSLGTRGEQIGEASLFWCATYSKSTPRA